MKREMNLKWILLGNFTTVETRHAKKSVNFFFFLLYVKHWPHCQQKFY